MSTIAVLGTFDTKGIEHAYVAEQIRHQGHTPLLINVGALEASQIPADITCEQVAAVGGVDLVALKARKDRGETVAAMAKAAAMMMQKLVADGKIDGVISLGGGGGTAIGTAAMRALPIGFPKLMVSTLASGNTAQYVGSKDIVMFPSIVDVAGLNRISRQILTHAAGAICGMVSTRAPKAEDKPIIVASMFGNTTIAVNHAKGILEQAGYEVLVFHSTGTGGRTMESLIESGMVSGVLDITTTEWADEVAGGFLTAGPTRLEAAARKGVPAIVAPGCLDMVNFHGPDTVPAKYQGRKFYQHNPQVTLMRTNAEENRTMGRMIAERLNLSTGPVTVLLPLKGFSVIAAPGGSFHDAAADEAFCGELKKGLRKDIPVIEMDCVVNDLAFADRCARTLLQQIEAAKK
ncbi:MAG TPA: Tm-1-like ATP-binding domain-containing protein [Verrucomicrobiae bacterium]